MTFMELLLSAKLGSTSAFEELFARYKNLLRKYSVVNGVFDEDLRAVLSGCPVDSRPLPGRHGQNTVTDTFQFTGAVIALHILAVASHGVG